jgi:hypothetical protein
VNRAATWHERHCAEIVDVSCRGLWKAVEAGLVQFTTTVIAELGQIRGKRVVRLAPVRYLLEMPQYACNFRVYVQLE